MQPAPREMRYDATTMFFHWATAILVATQWLGAQTIDWFPGGPLRVDVRSVHITCGALLAVLLLARIA
jgi:cytochrome b561